MGLAFLPLPLPLPSSLTYLIFRISLTRYDDASLFLHPPPNGSKIADAYLPKK